MSEISFSPALVWAIIGLLLLAAELATISFILCFIGLGALIVALTTWIGLTPGFNSQVIVFSVSSLLLMIVLRKTAKKLFAGTNDVVPDYLGQKVKVIREIPPGGEGAIEYRSSDWIAFSEEKDIISTGKTVEIVAIEGIRVKVKSVAL
jgi:membrane protein implicated in regulation of membrane protease activity